MKSVWTHYTKESFMDNFLRLTDEETKGQSRKGKLPKSHVTPQRIEKLKKTFQPFWMRGMILHKKDVDQTSKEMNDFSHI
jgi:hypothetical protein